MRAITYTHARQNLAKTMDEIIDNHDPIIITRNNGRAVVMMSLEDFNAWQETAYLMSNPANARRLMRSIESLEQGKGKVRELLEE
ncbi:type II toxin-antitoxin system Phd/YefM family antitoxin [Calidithermus timidus]|jgi:antitoxin YefM|uniref:type II toxin-antitoxin system Phd/YefM family antitoxin n=1 Tax=Calidithermus timidus TaxID=307124 RepID=UPI00036AD831|nr:type II toxin-antitoxin system prevent-host-death family antitoxin [Calidithermus timidus]